jgi:hypothetical protein
MQRRGMAAGRRDAPVGEGDVDAVGPAEARAHLRGHQLRDHVGILHVIDPGLEEHGDLVVDGVGRVDPVVVRFAVGGHHVAAAQLDRAVHALGRPGDEDAVHGILRAGLEAGTIEPKAVAPCDRVGDDVKGQQREEECGEARDGHGRRF